MSPAGGGATGNTWADIVFLLFGCRRTRKVAVHCHVSSPKPTEMMRVAGSCFSPPSKKQPTAAALEQRLDDVFCFTGHGVVLSKPGVSSDGSGQDRRGFIAPAKKGVSAKGCAPFAGGEVVKPEAGGDAPVESVFCTTCPVTKDGKVGGGSGRGSLERKNGGRAGRDRVKKKLPLGEIRNGGAGTSNGSAVLQQQQSKPSYRRKNAGAAPPVSGRVTVVPRRSVDSAAKPAPSPPSGSPPIRNKQLRPRLSSSGSSFESLTSLTSDADGGNYSRGTFSMGSSATRRSSTGRRRRRPIILSADMPEKLQQDALDCTARAIEDSSDHEDIAASIKKEFDELHGAKWHCIVGRHFGSFVTAESNHFVHLYLGKVAVLLFKAGA